jgi:hypothetical protein
MGRFYIPTLGAKCAMEYLFRSLTFRPFGFVSDLEFRISDFSLPSAFGGNFNQSKANDYAKQTQFLKSQKCFNPSEYKELQRTMNYELLSKQTQSNPILPLLRLAEIRENPC